LFIWIYLCPALERWMGGVVHADMCRFTCHMSHITDMSCATCDS